MSNQDNDYIEVSFTLKINMKVIGEVKEILHRKRDTYAFDLDQVAEYICRYEKKYNFQSTDVIEVLEDLSREGFISNSGKTIQELFNLYWCEK